MEEKFKRRRLEPDEVLAARVIKERAKGRCEYEWGDKDFKRQRCRELHGERALFFKGIVHLQLMPAGGLSDRRLSSQRAYCQKHAYELLRQMSQAVAVKKTRSEKSDTNQICMF